MEICDDLRDIVRVQIVDQSVSVTDAIERRSDEQTSVFVDDPKPVMIAIGNGVPESALWRRDWQGRSKIVQDRGRTYGFRHETQF